MCLCTQPPREDKFRKIKRLRGEPTRKVTPLPGFGRRLRGYFRGRPGLRLRTAFLARRVCAERGPGMQNLGTVQARGRGLNRDGGRPGLAVQRRSLQPQSTFSAPSASSSSPPAASPSWIRCGLGLPPRPLPVAQRRARSARGQLPATAGCHWHRTACPPAAGGPLDTAQVAGSPGRRLSVETVPWVQVQTAHLPF